MTQITKEAIEAAVEEIRKVRKTPVWDRWTDHDAIGAVLEAALPFLPIAVEGKEPLDWEDPVTRAKVIYRARQLWNEDQYSCAWSDENREHYMIRAAFELAPSSPGKDGGQEVELAAYQQQRAEQGLEEDPTVYPDWSVGGGQEVERDFPAEFEAWWKTYRHKNREPADYSVKKQIAFDAFYFAARPQPASTALVERLEIAEAALTQIANAFTAHTYSDAMDAVQALKDIAKEALNAKR